MRSIVRRALVATLALAALGCDATAQGAVAINDLAAGLRTSVRILMIGAHPDDEDTQLLTWLARSQRADVAYLSLTRGDGGQNAIGTELGEALGVIRTEELLAARRVDGARQFFTRAYDFGFSKSPAETYEHWPRDSVFGDVVRIVRAFRPHIIVAVFSGTPRDGHGHHQVSGMLASEAFDLSGDVTRFPATTHGDPWTAAKFYRAARFAPTEATVTINVGEYDPVRGRGLGELSGESRSQHRSQGFGSALRRGAVTDYVKLEASRVGAVARETSMFDGITPTLARFAGVGDAARQQLLARAVAQLDSIHRLLDLRAPDGILPLTARAGQSLVAWCTGGVAAMRTACTGEEPPQTGTPAATADLLVSAARTNEQLQLLAAAASGLVLDATAPRELVAEGDTATLTLRVTNRGARAARVAIFTPAGATAARTDSVKPGETVIATMPLPTYRRSGPWWLGTPARNGDLFLAPASLEDEERRSAAPTATVPALVDGVAVQLRAPIVYKRVDEVRGELDTPVQFVAPVTLAVEGGPVALARADAPLDRVIVVRVTAHAALAAPVQVALVVPAGLRVDSASRTRTIPAGTSVPVRFRVTGLPTFGVHEIRASATLLTPVPRTFTDGFVRVAYDHIRPQHLPRPATLVLSAIPTAAVPPAIGYLRGLADNMPAALEQLGARVELLTPATLDDATLARQRVIVVGPRALEGQPGLLAQMPRLHDWVRRGGTLLVQYQQTDLALPGAAPFPVQFTRPADRVTEEDAEVRVLDPRSPLLGVPNRISSSDWLGWVQERASYMPRTVDRSYRTVLSMNDTGEPPNNHAIMELRMGRGVYVFTSLALFRQVPAGVPGATRLFVNLLHGGRGTAAPGRLQP